MSEFQDFKGVETIEFKTITDKRGSLVAIEELSQQLPFPLRRIYYMFDVNPTEPRGFHAHRELHQTLVCLSGAVRVVVDNGDQRKEHALNAPGQGLYTAPGVWVEMHDFTPDAVFMALASDVYNEQD
jgi:UDP-2-acetamido-3-amino-2,3-dideoxy-glucuronate N-acetyltransferase